MGYELAYHAAAAQLLADFIDQACHANNRHATDAASKTCRCGDQPVFGGIARLAANSFYQRSLTLIARFTYLRFGSIIRRK
jgi:hypothetical protein